MNLVGVVLSSSFCCVWGCNGSCSTIGERGILRFRPRVQER